MIIVSCDQRKQQGRGLFTENNWIVNYFIICRYFTMVLNKLVQKRKIHRQLQSYEKEKCDFMLYMYFSLIF